MPPLKHKTKKKTLINAYKTLIYAYSYLKSFWTFLRLQPDNNPVGINNRINSLP